jgi:hypothetical protein
MTIRRVTCAVLFAVFMASPAPAQDESHWGVAGTFVPRWEFLHFLEDAMEREVEMTGNDLRVGVIRGRQLGGDWGVSFVSRRIDDDSIVIQQESLKCVARPGQSDLCARGAFHRTRGAKLTGGQFHRFFVVGTIARRVQIGAVLSGGVARVSGGAEEAKEHLQVTVNPATGAAAVSISSVVSTVLARHVFDETPVSVYVPIGGLEAAVAVLLTPGTKLRFSGGISFPGVHRFALTAQYLFSGR